MRFDWLVISFGSDVSSPAAVAEGIFHSWKVKFGPSCSVYFLHKGVHLRRVLSVCSQLLITVHNISIAV